jgi:hypothetical protein
MKQQKLGVQYYNFNKLQADYIRNLGLGITSLRFVIDTQIDGGGRSMKTCKNVQKEHFFTKGVSGEAR